MPVKSKAKPKSQKLKYPYLIGCYVDEEFSRGYHRKYLQGRVAITHYKGAMLLRVTEENPCNCHPVRETNAWLRGDDLDAVIAMLREAKKVWLRAYRRAELELRRRGRKRD